MRNAHSARQRGYLVEFRILGLLIVIAALSLMNYLFGGDTMVAIIGLLAAGLMMIAILSWLNALPSSIRKMIAPVWWWIGPDSALKVLTKSLRATKRNSVTTGTLAKLGELENLHINDKKDGETALHLVIRQFPSFETELDGIVSLLLRHGADPNARTDYGETPLLYATFYGAPAVVNQLLLKAGADPDIADNRGRAPRAMAQTANTPQQAD
jgi:hypothetical protein